MDISYIEKKLKEIYLLRSSIKKEMRIDVTTSQSIDIHISNNTRFKRSFSDLKSMKVACIMDEFTYHSFDPECNLVQITPQSWLEEFENLQPDLFFLESAWRGIEGLWYTKVAHLSNEIIDVLSYCKENNIPIVFWNKEDPIHFDTFIAVAKYADFVFTTDIDCINKYKALLKHNNVFLMPFAAQLKYHNPIETEIRKDKFCFAGAYYKRYPERTKDLETFVDTITKLKELDIYDRNYYNQDPNYTFPNSYKKYIVGNLKANEIEKAYKGYRFNINMNSVKQSQSMCARRIFELLASNTIAVSNYSRAIRNFFGDLVINTDDGKRLYDEITKLNDNNFYSKFRLLGLRKALSEHTYQDRLAYLVNKVYENPINQKRKFVSIISQADTNEEIMRFIKQFQRQKYNDKQLIIISSIKTYDLPENVMVISELTDNMILKLQKDEDYWTFFSVNDYYGENYISDLVLALKYSEVKVICKDSYFEFQDGLFVKNNENSTYRKVNSARLRRALIHSSQFNSNDLKSYSLTIDQGEIYNTPSISIDEYNYCMNYIEDSCQLVDDLILTDKGLDMESIYEIAEQIEPNSIEFNNISLKAKDMLERFGNIKNKEIQIKKEQEDILIESHLNNAHDYIYFKDIKRLEELNINKNFDIYLNVDFITRFSVEVVVILLDIDKNKISSSIKPCNRKITIEYEENAYYLRVGLRLSGSGICRLKELIVGNIELDSGCFMSKSNVLLVTDNYPDYDDLYRYAFIHSRLLEYKNKGLNVDVFKCSDRHQRSFSEFNGIDISSGYYEEANTMLSYGNYDTVLIHFLSKNIWQAIKSHLNGKKVIIWVHGSEIQPWWRREYNYSSNTELDRAKIESDQRLEFWREIFDAAINDVNTNLHFVFVSNYFANEVFEDLQIKLPETKYSIIHNYINNDLFNYIEKDKEQRKKILSIRPFANRKYANDLTVKAILELSGDPIFKDLEFRIIGKGELFDKTLKPIRKFKNVSIEERFLRQEEIAEIHKDYGIFVVPTRMDSQGVSRDEAMSSGLVPITTNVTAIPEFVDNESGILVADEDYKGLANGIKMLYHNSDLYSQLSQNAAKRVREQSGIHRTVEKEIALIKSRFKE